MDMRPVALLERFRGKFFRYAAVSFTMTVLTQCLLWIFVHELNWAFAPANVVAVSLVVLPAFLANRSFVWRADGIVSWRTEVLPFWVLTFSGLILSTIFAALADTMTDAVVAVHLANVAGFGVLWIVKFLILDEFLFGTPE